MGIIDAVKSGNVPLDKYLMGGAVGAILGSALSWVRCAHRFSDVPALLHYPRLWHWLPRSNGATEKIWQSFL